MSKDFVDVNDYGIKGVNYYLMKMEQFGIVPEELAAIGITDHKALVRREMMPSLEKARQELLEKGYDIIIKDAYRSPELYKLVQKKRYERDGKEATDRTFNAREMPHASGFAIDVNLLDPTTGQEIKLWDNKDWPDGSFVDFYQDRTDATGRKYQELQELLISTMMRNGFKLGKMREFWHFIYESGGRKS
jgi:D-alanyl-D-alanine dipeptidase